MLTILSLAAATLVVAGACLWRALSFEIEVIPTDWWR